MNLLQKRRGLVLFALLLVLASLLLSVAATGHAVHAEPAAWLLLPVFLFGLVEAMEPLSGLSRVSEARRTDDPARPWLFQLPPPRTR